MKESAPKSGYPMGEDHPEDAGSSTLISRAFVPPCIPVILTTARTASLGPASAAQTGTLDAYY